MGKKSGKNEPTKVDPVYVLGLDTNGKPLGARFGELKDNICSAAMDLNCRVLIDPPAAVSVLGMKLPAGRVHGTGKIVKLFVPNIRRELYDQILEAARVAEEQSSAAMGAGSVEQPAEAPRGQADAAQAVVRTVSPVTSGLPRNWESIAVGHMVLVHESPADGWWEATVLKREDEILTLRFRDYPKQPTFIRHINTVALVNPGPA
jgi:hypothetical protein